MTNLQEAADLNDTVAVSARRFEESPFILRQDDSKMVRGIHLNAPFADALYVYKRRGFGGETGIGLQG